MGVIKFISDLHMKHNNMAIKRGFQDSYCHDENLIAQWNLYTSKKDTVFILGDLTMEKNDYGFLDRLNGIKKVIGGNHDELNHFRGLLPYVNGFGGMSIYKSKEFGRFYLTHCPIYVHELDIDLAKGVKSYNIHGHIHDAYIIPDKRYINVSAEVIDYIPKTLKELLNE